MQGLDQRRAGLVGVGWALLLVLLAGCGQALAQPSPTPSVEIPTASCIQDKDCAFALRLDRCCSCPEIYSRQYVDADPRLLLYRERQDYAYPVARVHPASCLGVQCAPCPMPPPGPICSDGVCRAPERWDEVLRVCAADTDAERARNCYTQAAQLAYLQVGLDQSLALCERTREGAYEGHPEKEECAVALGRLMLQVDPDQAEGFCLDHLQQSRSRCLKEAGETIAIGDADAGLEICERIETPADDDRFQRDACFHNVAMLVGKVDLDRARAICERMSERAEECKESAGRVGE